MRMVEQILRPRHRRERDVGLQAEALELVLGVALEDLGDPGHQPGPRLDAQVVGAKPRIQREFLLTKDVAETLPLAIAGDADETPAGRRWCGRSRRSPTSSRARAWAAAARR